MKVHLIMPMAGAGSRFQKEEYPQPKPLIRIEGKPFFYWAAQSALRSAATEDLTFVVLRQHVETFRIDGEIARYFPEARLRVLEEVLPGAVFTALEGVKDIRDALPVLINDCDHLFRCRRLAQVLAGAEPVPGKSAWDGALLTFESDQPQYSYVRYDLNHRVVGTVEKRVVSRRAICGAYLFRNAALFRELADGYIQDCPYKECFLSGLYSVLCEQGGNVLDIPLDDHVEFGTPEEYAAAKGSSCFYDIDH